MKLSNNHLTELCTLAETAALAAGKMVGAVDHANLQVEYKAGGVSLASQVVTQVDLDSEAIILSYLKASCDKYDLAWLAEESSDNERDHARFKKDYFWCIDPLDGTLPFTEIKSEAKKEGNDQGGYAVSIALVEQSGKPVLGVVYDVFNQILYSKVKGHSLCRNGQPWQSKSELNEPDTLHVFFDRSFLLDNLYEKTMVNLNVAAKKLGLKTVNIHSHFGAVINACSVLELSKKGQRACYFKFPKNKQGGGSLWDFSATAALFDQSDWVVGDIHGQALKLNRSDSTFMNHQGVLFASDEMLANHIKQLYLIVAA
jgi:myo-inositol-1(or 4)-monophosphatase